MKLKTFDHPIKLVFVSVIFSACNPSGRLSNGTLPDSSLHLNKRMVQENYDRYNQHLNTLFQRGSEDHDLFYRIERQNLQAVLTVRTDKGDCSKPGSVLFDWYGTFPLDMTVVPQANENYELTITYNNRTIPVGNRTGICPPNQEYSCQLFSTLVDNQLTLIILDSDHYLIWIQEFPLFSPPQSVFATRPENDERYCW